MYRTPQQIEGGKSGTPGVNCRNGRLTMRGRTAKARAKDGERGKGRRRKKRNAHREEVIREKRNETAKRGEATGRVCDD